MHPSFVGVAQKVNRSKGDSAAIAHRSALHAKDAPMCFCLIGSCGRYVRASLASDSVLSKVKIKSNLSSVVGSGEVAEETERRHYRT